MFVSANVSLDSPVKIIKAAIIIRGFKRNSMKLVSPESLSNKDMICF